MDECDTAALAYQCGQERAPNLVANAIATMERNTSVVSLSLCLQKNIIHFILTLLKTQESVPLPPSKAKCNSEYECIIDVKILQLPFSSIKIVS